MAGLHLFEDVIAEISSRLTLRDPNRDAVQTLAAKVSQFYHVERKEPPFEAVIASATGVGKTYILASAIEFFAISYAVSDFVIITPGRVILDKTRDNFTLGHPKSLLAPMSFHPVVITAENFDTPAMRTAMDDDSQIKIYLFTVQSLIKPQSKASRKTHKFQEGLGAELYERLKAISQLVVLADEHHCYYGRTFSSAVRDLDPWVLVGLTATPHKNTPKDQIIFRYSLAAAIAEKLVKTPVIVGRKDDRNDPETKLTDGIILLQAKEQAIAEHVAVTPAEPINPVMLVVAKSISDANEYSTILRSEEFFRGAYANAVLLVHSSAPDNALAELAKVEDPTSPVRIIISVGMLKEGWDARNVYVIASMRSSVSEILTEQTLGRGMRLPFGFYTEIEILDTLEVLAHERYHDLLKNADILTQALVDHRTRTVIPVNTERRQALAKKHGTTSASPVNADEDGESGLPANDSKLPPISSTEERKARARAAVKALRFGNTRRSGLPLIDIPVLKMTNIRSPFSLADIISTDAFRKLGTSLATDPDYELSRTLVSAQMTVGPDGVKRTELITKEAADRVWSPPSLFPAEVLRERLSEAVLTSSCVPSRGSERAALEPMLRAFFDALGDKAASVLSANLDRAAARFIRLVENEQRKYMAKPSFDEVIELRRFLPSRATDRKLSHDRYGAFNKLVAYSNWQRGMYTLSWFDSRPERTVANMIDNDQSVTCWARLHIGDIPILWESDNRHYNPDLLVVENDSTHWLVEVKMDKEITSADVLAKREAAIRWTNHVNSKIESEVRWRYLFASESDINTAKDSWTALKQLVG